MAVLGFLGYCHRGALTCASFAADDVYYFRIILSAFTTEASEKTAFTLAKTISCGLTLVVPPVAKSAQAPTAGASVKRPLTD